jgi:hypothetical protein
MQLDRVVGYRIEGDQLQLLNDTGDLVALFNGQ